MLPGEPSTPLSTRRSTQPIPDPLPVKLPASHTLLGTAPPTSRQSPAVGPAAVAVDRLDLLDQGAVLHRPRALRPVQPVVEATGRCLQNSAHQAHWKVPAMMSDELELHFAVSEKMEMAFFKTSRSMRRR